MLSYQFLSLRGYNSRTIPQYSFIAVPLGATLGKPPYCRDCACCESPLFVIPRGAWHGVRTGGVGWVGRGGVGEEGGGAYCYFQPQGRSGGGCRGGGIDSFPMYGSVWGKGTGGGIDSCLTVLFSVWGTLLVINTYNAGPDPDPCGVQKHRPTLLANVPVPVLIVAHNTREIQQYSLIAAPVQYWDRTLPALSPQGTPLAICCIWRPSQGGLGRGGG